MVEVMQSLLNWLTALFDALLSQKSGSYIGAFIVFSPILIRVVRAVRSIINNSGSA